MNKHWKSEKFSHAWTDEQRQLQNWEDEAVRQEVEWYRQKYLEAVFKANQLNLPLEFNHDHVPQRREESPRAEADARVRAERAAEPPAQHVHAHDPDGRARNDPPAHRCSLGGAVGCFCSACMKW
ncbi:hypothetical protein Axy16_049 [Achromobacter phage vB_AxyS_19-32_Axy16]|nr:hypothetical protein Axy16_049 [Achromobacter phage vB_AxyS_19-32_Axy16]